MQKPKVLLAHPGTQHARYLAIELYKKGLLYKFYTGIMMPRNNLFIKCLLKILPGKVSKKFNGRLINDIPASYIKLSIKNELQTVRQLKDPTVDKEKLFYTRNKAFQKNVAKSDIEKSDVIIGFDTSAWLLAEEAKKLNKKFILDQTTAEPSEKDLVLQKVAIQFPEWKSDVPERLAQYSSTDFLEHSLADAIVVASSYTKDSLIRKNIAAQRIFINPYGTDVNFFTPAPSPLPTDKVNFLFVGAVSALKGIPLLLQAWETMDTSKAQLFIAGDITDKLRSKIMKMSNITVLGAFPKDGLLTIYRSCHVFVFPSYSDGFGQVILEALACGLPVIASENSGGKDVITDNIEGFVIPTGSVKSLQDAMRFFLDNKAQIKVMSKAARLAAASYTWERYGERWKQIIERVTQREA